MDVTTNARQIALALAAAAGSPSLRAGEPLYGPTATPADHGAADKTLLRAMIDQVPDLLFVKDCNSRFIIANIATALDLGQASPDDLIGRTDAAFYDAGSAAKFAMMERDVIHRGIHFVDQEELGWNATGDEKWFSVTKLPLRDETGVIIGLVGCCRNITERKREDRLRKGQAAVLELIARDASLSNVLETLLRLVEAEGRGIKASILLNDGGHHLRHCAAPTLPLIYVQAIDGVAIGEGEGSCGTAAFRGKPVIAADIATDPLWDNYRALILPLELRACWSWPILSPDGTVLGTSAMYSPEVRGPSAFELQLAAFTTHIAGIAIQRKIAEDRIHFLAHHDHLTGLPNRLFFERRVDDALREAAAGGHKLSIVFLDLDNFKIVNDNLGHRAGDALLKLVANRIKSCLLPSDLVVRFGGDEFVLLLAREDLAKGTVIERIRHIKNSISAPVDIEGSSFHVTSSMGISHFPADGVSHEELLANADAALYRAKEFGRDNFQLFSRSMKSGIEDQLLKREDLRRAIQESEFVLHYQPQLDLAAGSIVGAEALLRWQHPRLGLLLPAEFIPLAEQTGLIVPLGDWVLRTACAQGIAWQASGLSPITISVNVSARQFRELDWVRRVESALDATGLAARFLELELTESLIMQDPQRAIEAMNELRALGAQIAIDDFGTGYSSLSSLKTFPISRLKIDRSFTVGLPDAVGDSSITAAVITLGHALGMRVIAEGVETEKQRAFLVESGCDEIQGFLVSRPLTASRFRTFLRHRQTVLRA